MRNADPIVYPSDSLSLSCDQERQRNYEDAINILQTQWTQADTDQRFCLGDQDIWGQLYPNATGYKRKVFNFNIINPIVQAISGQQRQSRKSTVAIPLQNGGQKTADLLSKCLYHVHNQPGTYQVYSDAFEKGAVTQGIGLISVFKDLRDDPVSGDFRLRYVDFKSVIMDPFFRQPDLSDCRFIWTRQFFDRQEAALLFPEIEDKIMNIGLGGYRDDKFYYIPEVYQIQFPNLIAFDEYWYLSQRQATYLVDTETSEMQEFSGDEEDMRIIYMNFGNRLKLIQRPKQTVRRQIIINDKAIVDEESPYGIDRYPYVPVLGYFNPDTSYYALKFRGIVRDMRDAQFLFNRRKAIDLDILEAQQQGLKVKKGALVTPDDALNQGNGRVLVVSDKAQMSDIEPMPIVPPSPVMLQMEEMLMDVAYRIAGVDPSSMGIDVDDKAGIISMMRHAATARNLQTLFDNLDFAQIQVGNLLTELIQKNWTFTKVKLVTGEEPTPEFDNKLFFKYGCKVTMASLTESQQQLELAQVIELQKMYPQLDLHQEVVDIMQIQNKDKIKEKLAQQAQQAAEQQQQMSQLQMQQMQVDNQTKLSYAESQRGLAAERIARIDSDIAIAQDKIKRAQTEDTESLLNVIKAIKELEQMDLDQLKGKLEILQTLQPEVTKEAEVTKNSEGIQKEIERKTQLP